MWDLAAVLRMTSIEVCRLFVRCSALICMKNAPNLNPKNFHALTRLDENRAKCQVRTLPCCPTPNSLGPNVYQWNESGICSEVMSTEPRLFCR